MNKFQVELNFMDKSRTHHERILATYRNGVMSFIKHVRATIGPTVDIRCPCIKCMNLYTKTQEEVSSHLCINGIMPSYDKWIYHGEPIPRIPNEHGQNIFSQNEEFMDYDLDGDEDEIETLMEDINRGTFAVGGNEDTFQNRNHTRFEQMLNMLDKELYPGCQKYSILSFVIKLLHLKVFNHWTNKSIDMLLELIKDVLPDGANLPKSYYEAKTMLREIGLGYLPIHACK